MYNYSYNYNSINNSLCQLKKAASLGDTAVEIEIRLEDPIIDLLTTEDGTLKPLFTNARQKENTPIWLHTKAKQTGYKNLENFNWNELTNEEKLLLLQAITRHREIPFKENRNLIGVKVKSRTNAIFKEPKNFLGSLIPPGTHDLDIAKIFRQVEILSHRHVDKLEKIELHFRANETAGCVSNSAWTFLDGLGLSRTHQHVHIVAPLPIDLLKKYKNKKIVELVDNFIRTNLVAEMRTIVRRKGTIYSRDREDRNFFKYLTPEILNSLINYLKDVSDGLLPPIGDTLKKGWVGYRGHDKYDGNKNLHGYEVRDIKPTDDINEVKEFLDTIQYFMINYATSIPSSGIDQWLEIMLQKYSLGDALQKAWYNRTWNELFEDAPKEVKNILDDNLKEKLQSVISKSSYYDMTNTNNFQIKMLVHNWNFCPLVFNDTDFLSHIIDMQIFYLENIANNNDPIKTIREFLIDSKIFTFFNLSLSR